MKRTSLSARFLVWGLIALFVLTIMMRAYENKSALSVRPASYTAYSSSAITVVPFASDDDDANDHDDNTPCHKSAQLAYSLQSCISRKDTSFPSTLLGTPWNTSTTIDMTRTTHWSRGVLFHSCPTGICGVVLTHITSSVFAFDPPSCRDSTADSTSLCVRQQRLFNTPRTAHFASAEVTGHRNCTTGPKLHVASSPCLWCPFHSSITSSCHNGTLFARDVFEDTSITDNRLDYESVALANNRSYGKEDPLIQYRPQYKATVLYCRFPSYVLPRQQEETMGTFMIPHIQLSATVNSRPVIPIPRLTSNADDDVLCVLSPPTTDFMLHRLQHFVEYHTNVVGLTRVLFYDAGLSPRTIMSMRNHNAIHNLMQLGKLVVIDLRNEFQSLYGGLATEPIIFSHGNMKTLSKTDCIHRARHAGNVRWLLFVKDLTEYITVGDWTLFTSHILSSSRRTNHENTKWLQFGSTTMVDPRLCNCSLTPSSLTVVHQQQQQQQTPTLHYSRDHVALRMDVGKQFTNEWAHNDLFDPTTCIFSHGSRVPSNVAFITRHVCAWDPVTLHGIQCDRAKSWNEEITEISELVA